MALYYVADFYMCILKTFKNWLWMTQAGGQCRTKTCMFENQFHILYKKIGPISFLVKP